MGRIVEFAAQELSGDSLVTGMKSMDTVGSFSRVGYYLKSTLDKMSG